MKATVAILLLIMLFPIVPALGQTGLDGLVTYEKRSAFVHEFQTPMIERGLRGITTDPDGNVWVYHLTNETSTVLRFDVGSGEFSQYSVKGKTVSDNAVVNLAAAQVAFDSQRNSLWFTDARMNSVGTLDVQTGETRTWQLPTSNSGPMGIAISPDGRSVWVAEITGDRIARIDSESFEIAEYDTGEGSGPALLTFDQQGFLWTSLSFADTVLRIDTSTLPSHDAMTEFTLTGKESFSPLGIAFSGDRIYVTDHSSNRVISSDLGFASFVSYWTSPSREFFTTLPGQIITDGKGNVYFPQHGGNRISAIDGQGLLTEYDIPTGPLATVIFLASSEGKIWFTEWASNKIAYLDTALKIPFEIHPSQDEVILTDVQDESIGITLKLSGKNTAVLLSEIDVSVLGMTENGLQGVTYETLPPAANMTKDDTSDIALKLHTEAGAVSGRYTIIVRATAAENDGLLVSKLYPVSLTIDVQPQPVDEQDNRQTTEDSRSFQDLFRIVALSAAAALSGYLVYKRVIKRALQL